MSFESGFAPRPASSRFAPRRGPPPPPSSTGPRRLQLRATEYCDDDCDDYDYDANESRYDRSVSSAPSPHNDTAAAAAAATASADYADPEGLPLRSLPAVVLSSPSSLDARRAERRAEYLEVTRRNVVPKLAELTGRLVPAAIAALGGGGSTAANRTSSAASSSSGGGGLMCASGHDDDDAERDEGAAVSSTIGASASASASASGGYKTTGLDDDDDGAADSIGDLEGGSHHQHQHRQLHRYSSSNSSSGGDDCPVSPLASPFPGERKSVGGNGVGDGGDGDGGDHGLLGRLCLPREAAMLAAGLQAPSLSMSEDGGGDSPSSTNGEGVSSPYSPRHGYGEVVAAETIAASLGSDVALLDYEADALLRSLRGDVAGRNETSAGASGAGGGRGGGSGRRHRRTDSVDSSASEGGEAGSVTSYDTMDTMMSDDGMGGEIRRLGHVVDSLRRDLAGFESSSRSSSSSSSSVLLGTEDATGGTRGNRTIDGTRRGNGGGGDLRRTSRLARRLQTWKYFGLRGDNGRGNDGSASGTAALYWAVAMVWAIVILLAGHVKLRQAFGDDDGSGSWEDVLGWLFSGGGSR